MRRVLFAGLTIGMLSSQAIAFDVVLKHPPRDGWLKATVYLKSGQTKSYTYKAFKLLKHNTNHSVIAVMKLPQYRAKDITKVCYRPRSQGERCVSVKDDSWTHIWFN